MTTQRRLATLFVVTPLFFPLLITALFYLSISREFSYFLVNTHNEYSLFLPSEDTEMIAEKTIQVISGDKLALQKIDPQGWIFSMDGDQLRDSSVLVAEGEGVVERGDLVSIPRDRRAERAGMDPKGLVPEESKLERERKFLAGKFDSVSRRIDTRSPLSTSPSEEDPFLKEWKKQQKSDKTIGYIALNKAKTPPIPPTTPPKESSPASAPSPAAAYIIDNGESHPDSLLNFNIADDRYLNYETLEGRIEWPNISHEQYFAEVSFYDQIGPQGLDDDSSTALASQEIRDPNHSFSLRVPIESRGFIIAKIYAWQDLQKENPLYMGAYGKNPIIISKNGVPGLLLSVVSKTKYLEKYETVFEGKLINEYEENTQGVLAAAHVWVAETGQHVESNEKGYFEIKGLLQSQSYQLIFEKEAFMTTQVPIKMDQKRKTQTFSIAPLSKFTKGYDLLLGGRDPSKSIVFATLLKKGMPLSKTIVKAPQSQKVVYERTTDLISLPDPTLFSSTENGKVLLWNIAPGKNKIDIFQNGEWMASRVVKLSPGVTHHLVLEF